MECPVCGKRVAQKRDGDGGLIFFCKQCGWGKDRLAESASEDTDRPVRISKASWIRLPLFWIISLGVIFGPYLAIVYGFPAFVEWQNLEYLKISPEALAAKLTPGYWIVILIYVLLSTIITPRYDPENLGLFGSRWVDNPFTYDDDYNRTMQSLAIFFLPGKIIWVTVKGTARLVWFLITRR